MRSIMQKEKACYACGAVVGLEEHHVIFGTANRAKSEQYGLKVWLCRHHHTGGPESVHQNRDFDLYLKHKAQMQFEREIGSREDFIREFGKSYL